MRSILRKLLFTIPVYLLSISSLSAQNFTQEEKTVKNLKNIYENLKM